MRTLSALLRRPSLTGRSLRGVSVARAVGVTAALLTILAGIPDVQASSATTVTRTVKGAQVARFTLKRAAAVAFDVKADRGSPLYGLMLARVGGDGYLVDVTAAGFGRRLQTSYNLPPNGPTGASLAAGTYDLTLFSQTTAKVQARLTGVALSLRFASRPLQALTTTSADTSPTWEHGFQFSLKARPHGAVVYMRDEWTGSGRSSQTVCVAEPEACSGVNGEALDQLTSGSDVPGDHASNYGETFASDDFSTGTNNVTVTTTVVGQAKRHAALVLIVP